jgi:hypothetical protein
VRQQIEQLTADVSRYASFLNTYKHVLQTEQITASEPLAAFILSRELLKERNVLNEQIRKFERLGANDFERGVARNHGIVLEKLRTKINQASAAIDNQRKNALEGLEYDADLVKRETARRSRLRKRLNKLEEEGPPELGAMTEEIDTIVDLVTRYFVDLDNATADYNDARHITWAAGQTRRKLEEIEGMMPLLHAQTEQMRLSHRSLTEGIEQGQGTRRCDGHLPALGEGRTVRHLRRRSRASAHRADALAAAAAVPRRTGAPHTRSAHQGRARRGLAHRCRWQQGGHLQDQDA